MPTASVFHYLFISEIHRWNFLQFAHSAKNSIGAKVPQRDCFHKENVLLGLLEKQEGLAETAHRLGLSLFRWDMRLPLSAHALLTFFWADEEGKRHKADREMECFALNTLLTDCRAGMVMVDTDCLPTWMLSALPDLGTTVPVCQ